MMRFMTNSVRECPYFQLDDEYKIVNYYCPKKTYDAIMSGEVVKVDYYVDNNGVIAVDSISK